MCCRTVVCSSLACAVFIIRIVCSSLACGESLLVTGALLFDVINCSDMRKGKNRIASLLESKALEIMKDEQQADKFVGWTINNTRTNMAALQILSHERPKWIN
jgi:hypothetical protein